ncbi:DUF6580 family putative transport protein [Polluticaenibacter yanchengensis]|uniref:Lycopene cyclase domain-containing protein n=1 Tax=Polluticaenibacter yanchengensis TaxID=3014562 RepID=A0ABT4UNR0_9BACT|nr:hypothetical protein [Chitinophagaceae bacterium LY-5]
MKIDKRLLLAFVILIAGSVIYKVIPYETRSAFLGAPVLAASLFSGSVINEKKYAFLIPLLILFLGDLVMQLMHWNNPVYSPGFYSGQITNYALIISLVTIGFFTNSRKYASILIGAGLTATLFFLMSNFMVWAQGYGLHTGKTLNTLYLTYIDGLPFYKNDLIGTVVFSLVFFTAYNFAFTSEKSQKLA